MVTGNIHVLQTVIVTWPCGIPSGKEWTMNSFNKQRKYHLEQAHQTMAPRFIGSTPVIQFSTHHRVQECAFRYLQSIYPILDILVFGIFQKYLGLQMVSRIFWNTRRVIPKNPGDIQKWLEITGVSILRFPELFPPPPKHVCVFLGLGINLPGQFALILSF